MYYGVLVRSGKRKNHILIEEGKTLCGLTVHVSRKLLKNDPYTSVGCKPKQIRKGTIDEKRFIQGDDSCAKCCLELAERGITHKNEKESTMPEDKKIVYVGNFRGRENSITVHAMQASKDGKTCFPMCHAGTASGELIRPSNSQAITLANPRQITCITCKKKLSHLGVLLKPFIGLLQKNSQSPVHAALEASVSSGDRYLTTFCGWTCNYEDLTGRDEDSKTVRFKPDTNVKDRIRRLKSGSYDACNRCLESMRASGYRVDEEPPIEDIPDEDVFVILWKDNLKKMKVPIGHQPPSVFRTQKELEEFISITVDPALDEEFMNGKVGPGLIHRIVRTAITEDFELIPKTLGLKAKER